MSNNIIAIATTEAVNAARPFETLDDRLGAAFKSVRNSWICTNEDDQFMAGVTAVYELSDEETQERIKAELASLRALNAAVSGVPVSFEHIVVENPIGLVKKWRQVKGSVEW